MPCRCQPRGRQRKRSTRSDQPKNHPELVTCLLKVRRLVKITRGQNSTRANTTNARTALRSNWICPRRTRFGIIWARRQRKPRHSTPRISASHTTTSRVTSWTASLSHRPLRVLSIPILHMGPPIRHRPGNPHSRKQKSPTFTSQESL